MSNPSTEGQPENLSGNRDRGAILIPFDETEHFDREGFSGDIFVPKDSKVGFTALQITVDGKHPRKQIGKGNTRSYFVVDGGGTFILNDETRTVVPGDLIVIPSGNEYEYEGVMTLFEFNVSPRNTFRDKLVKVKKELTEVPVDETRQDRSDHHSANPQRERLAHDVAAILMRGYTLLSPDISEILPRYGYSPRLPAYSVIGSPSFRRMLDSHGVQLTEQMYKHRSIYLDANQPPTETDILETKARIDQAWQERKKPSNPAS